MSACAAAPSPAVPGGSAGMFCRVSATRRVEDGIGMPRGLQLVRYGGGGDFRFVDAALHVGLQRTNPEAFDADLVAAAAAEAVQLFACRCAIDESLPFPVRVMVLAMQALEAAAPAMIDMGRGNFWHGMPVLCSVAYWAAASWEVQVVASAPVPGGSRANLYFHGWLFETSRAQGRGAEVLQPLLGVFGALGSVNHDCGDGDLLAAGPSATFEQLSAHEMHYHGDSQLEGYPTAQAFKDMLMTVGGCSADEADEQHMIALALKDDLAFGTDMARVQLPAGPGCAIVVCVDTRACGADGQPAHPRILVTLLFLNEHTVVKQDLERAFWQTQLPVDCSLHDFFDSLPKLWTPTHLKCLQECLLLTS